MVVVVCTVVVVDVLDRDRCRSRSLPYLNQIGWGLAVLVFTGVVLMVAGVVEEEVVVVVVVGVDGVVGVIIVECNMSDCDWDYCM